MGGGEREVIGGIGVGEEDAPGDGEGGWDVALRLSAHLAALCAA